MSRSRSFLGHILPTTARGRWAWAVGLPLATATVIVASFWFNSWRAQRELDETVAFVEKKGGKVTLVGLGPPQWLEDVAIRFGVSSVDSISNYGIEVDLRGAQLRPSDLEKVAQLEDLWSLRLDQASGIDDDALTVLARAKSLHALRLNGTSVTDAGLRTIAGFPKLVHVEVKDTAVTDEGVASFLQRPTFTYLAVAGTRVRAVQPVDLQVTAATGSPTAKLNERLTVKGRIRARDGLIPRGHIVVEGTHEQERATDIVGAIYGHAADVTMQRNDAGLLEFSLVTERSGRRAGRHFVKAYLYWKQGQATVVYGLGEADFVLLPPDMDAPQK